MANLATYTIRLKDLVSNQLNKVSNNFKKATEESEKFKDKTSKGTNKLKKNFSGLNSLGRLAGARNGMAAFGSLTKVAGGGFGPIIAGLGLATVGAFKLGTALVESSTKLQNNLQIANQLLGGTAKETKQLTAQATALSNVYGADYTSTVQTASKLAKEFKITNAQAFDIIKKGYASGANIAGDMLKNIEESTNGFKKLGASAGQQIAIIQQSISNGIKDAPKLLNSFNENLPNLGGDVKRLLDKNFGKGFAKNLKANLDSGKTTALQALKGISTAMANTKFSKGAEEGLAKQIFGDGSADAVALLKNFASFDTSLDNLVAKNGAFNQSKLRQVELEKQLASAQLKSSKSFANIGNQVKIVGLKMKIAFFNGLNLMGSMLSKVSFVANAFVGFASRLANITGLTFALKTAWNVFSGGLIGTWNILKSTVGGLFTFVGNAIGAVNNLIDKALGSSFIQNIQKGFLNLRNTVGKVFNFLQTPITRIKDTLAGIVETLKGIRDFDFNKIQSGLASIKAGATGATDRKRQSLQLDSKKIGKEIGIVQKKVFKEEKKQDLFKLSDTPSLNNKSKSELSNGINSIVTGGSQTRNVTVTIQKMVGIEQLISSVKEAIPDVEQTLMDGLVRVIQGTEVAINKG